MSCQAGKAGSAMAEDRLYHARSRIGFIVQDPLAQLIAAAGLRADRRMGDGSGADYTPDGAEITALGARA